MMDDDIRDVEGAEGKGLSAEEVNKKLLEFGYNEVEEKKSNPVREFLKRFWGLTPWMLEIKIVFSYIIHKMIDVYIIAVLLVLNTIIVYMHEEKASKAV
jgi:Cation transport ATPase